MSYLFACAALAGAVGGLLGFGIGHMDGVAGLSGWRRIMFLEGVPTASLCFLKWPREESDAGEV